MKITIRPTSRQVTGRALFLSPFAGALFLAPAVIAMAATGRWRPLALLGIAAAALALAFLVAAAASRRSGVVLDEVGVHSVEGGPLPFTGSRSNGAGEYAPWTGIRDIHAERRRGRTVPVVYLDDPARPPWRLRVPYSGRALAADPELDEKIFVMRNLWETYRNGPVAGREP